LTDFFPEEGTNEAQDPRTQDPVGIIDKIYFPAQELAELLDDYGESAYSSPDEGLAV